MKDAGKNNSNKQQNQRKQTTTTTIMPNKPSQAILLPLHNLISDL
jgi:hypothetical protein